MQQYDAIILGFGKAGKTLAGTLAAQGKRVALVEKSPAMYGGTCINVGCIPSKSLVRSAGIAAQYADAPFAQKAKRYADAIAEKRRLTGMLRQKNYDKLSSSPNATVYDGSASFVDATHVQVQTATQTLTIQGKQIFINTGATSIAPKIQGIRDNPYVLFSDGLLDLDVLPRRLTIVGGGYIALEFASMYANFGSQVTVLQHGPTFLPKEDADIAAAIRGALEAAGVVIKLEAQTRAVQQAQDHAVVHYDWQGQAFADAADAVLLATGRRPNTDGLNLAAAGVQTTPRGAVVVDETLRTTAEGIWAMGDVAGGLQFTYVSLDDFRVVKSQLLGDGSYTTAQRKNVPFSVFLSPAYSKVGLNEREAVAAGHNIRVLKLPAAAIPKAQVLKQPTGLLKAIVDTDSKKILGAMLLCEESYEVINIVKLAMDMDADYTVLRDQVFTHPTMSEALGDLFAF